MTHSLAAPSLSMTDDERFQLEKSANPAAYLIV